MNNSLSPELIEIFDRNSVREVHEIKGFWGRLPQEVNFSGKKVLDFGSGLGTMAFELAERGAEIVHGIEIEHNYQVYSKHALEKQKTDVKQKTEFFSCDLADLENETYDIIISKDVFEHVIGLDQVFPELVKKLKPGGQLILGFGPLWYSPFGDHGVSRKIMGFKFPWLHLLLGEKKVVSFLHEESIKSGGSGVRSIQEAGYNGLVPSEYEQIIKSNKDIELTSWRVNVTNSTIASLLGGVINLFILLGLKKYLIRTVYLTATKK